MTVKRVEKDPENLTMTLTAEFDAPIERVWQVWEDPRQLERWWGPPSHPATVEVHDFTPGGRVSYYMTGPEGDRYHGWWEILVIEAPHRLEFEDGFADDAGEPNPDMPSTKTRVDLSGRGHGSTLMTIETTFPSVEAMEQVIAMGAEEGLALAVGQIDDLVAADSESV